MRNRRLSLASLGGLVVLLALTRTAGAGETRAKVIRIGAVAYSPAAVTIFEDIRRYFDRKGMPVDYVLYSHYDALVEALQKGQVDIAWNTPLAHAQYHRKAGNASQALVMRDVDCNVRSMLVVRADAYIRTLDDLEGKTLVLGSRQAAEATVLPIHFLKREGLNLTGSRSTASTARSTCEATRAPARCTSSRPSRKGAARRASSASGSGSTSPSTSPTRSAA